MKTIMSDLIVPGMSEILTLVGSWILDCSISIQLSTDPGLALCLACQGGHECLSYMPMLEAIQTKIYKHKQLSPYVRNGGCHE